MDVPTGGVQQVGHAPESPESGVLSASAFRIL